mgnify:FL=1
MANWNIFDNSHGIHWAVSQSEMILRAHLLNWFWRPREERRVVRTSVTASCIDKYLDIYLPLIKALEPDSAPAAAEPERLWSIWLQGEEAAPPLVKACWRSVRHNCPSHNLVILDSETVFDYITLPAEIKAKWRSGKISPAHFTDICRVELLYEHGGIWLDATDFVASDFPEWLWNEEFFLYLAGHINDYTFVQNCFIRARKGNFLVKAWRELMFAYWKENSRHFHYFQHQMMFKKIVESNDYAAALFAKMPKILQDPTHCLWWDYRDLPFDKDTFDAVTSRAMFQKTAYRYESARHPLPGSFADEMINRMFL